MIDQRLDLDGWPLMAKESKVDILVNNAGAAWGSSFDEFPEEGWDKVLDLNAPIAQEEFFGPVALMFPFDSEDEAVRLANDNAYGLGGAVFTQSSRPWPRAQRGSNAQPAPSAARFGGAPGIAMIMLRTS